MSNWKVGPGGRLYHPTTGAYVGQLDLNGNEQMVLGITTTSDQGVGKVYAGDSLLFSLTPFGIIPLANNIGDAGLAGFGVGICPTLPPGFVQLAGTTDTSSDNYGNYQYSDGSIMVWVPRFYYRIGSPASPRYATYGVNAIDIVGDSAFGSEADANSAGYALHRAFFDGGLQLGFFVDKYQCSNNGGIASSVRYGAPLSTAATHNPISALTGAGVEELRKAILDRLPEGPPYFPEDYLTDQPERFLAAELIRERILHETRQEVPHAVAVLIDEWEEKPHITRIAASIYVERDGQKGIIIGAGGSMLKKIGTLAREEMERMFGRRIYLELFVKVQPQWRKDPRFLDELDWRRMLGGEGE